MDTLPSDAVDKAKDAASDLADQAKDKAADYASQAKHAAEDKLSTGKEQATGALANVSQALHATGDALRDQDQDAFARYADMAAREVDQFTSAIRGRSVGELLDEAEGFARREPALFLGGAFLLGIFGSRFLKAGTDGASPRSLLSGMTMPGDSDASGSGEHQRLTNVNRPPSTAYGRDLAQAGTMPASTGAMPSGLSGGNLPAGNAAAGSLSSMGTTPGLAGAGADAPIRSGTGATPMSTSPMSGSGTPGSGTTATGTQGSGRTGADPS